MCSHQYTFVDLCNRCVCVSMYHVNAVLAKSLATVCSCTVHCTWIIHQQPCGEHLSHAATHIECSSYLFYVTLKRIAYKNPASMKC